MAKHDVPPAAEITLSLLGSFAVALDGKPVPTPVRESQHLLALLALRGRPVTRAAIAGTLWPEASEAHAYASLRSALSRLGDLAQEAILVTHNELALRPHVVVDVLEARALAHRLIEGAPVRAIQDPTSEAIRLLSADFLPDWKDDWAVLEAEEWRQLRLHALDALALRLVDAAQFEDAIAAALAAVHAEPLRESAWATLIRAHLAAGSRSDAVRTFDEYRALLAAQLGIEPTPALRALMDAS